MRAVHVRASRAAIILALLLAGGCDKTEIKQVQLDPTLTHDALAASNVWVLTVTSSPSIEPLRDFDASHEVSTLEGTLRTQRGDLHVAAADALLDRIDADSLAVFIQEYGQNGHWERELYDALSPLGPQPRYCLSGRITRNEVYKDVDSQKDEQGEKIYKLHRGRRVDLDVQLLDRESRKVVYKANLRRSDASTNDIPSTDVDFGHSFLGSLANLVLNSDPDFSDSQYPSAPSLSGVLEIMYADLSKELVAE